MQTHANRLDKMYLITSQACANMLQRAGTLRLRILREQTVRLRLLDIFNKLKSRFLVSFPKIFPRLFSWDCHCHRVIKLEFPRFQCRLIPHSCFIYVAYTRKFPILTLHLNFAPLSEFYYFTIGNLRVTPSGALLSIRRTKVLVDSSKFFPFVRRKSSQNGGLSSLPRSRNLK